MFSLYDQLRAVEADNHRIRARIADIEEFLGPYKDLGAVTMSLSISLDAPKAQRALIQRRADNPVLRLALEGSRPVEETYRELSAVNRGLRRFLPRGKNSQHNQQVKALTELVGPTGLETCGWFAFDNFSAGFVYAALPTYALFHLGATLIFHYILPPILSDAAAIDSSVNKFSIGTGAFMGALDGVFAQKYYRSSSQYVAQPAEKATYLDQKIQELCH